MTYPGQVSGATGEAIPGYTSLMATLLMLAAAGMAATLPIQAPQQNANGVPKAIMDRLGSGVNVTRWMCYLKDPNDQAHFRDYMKQTDWDAFKRLGVRFVRLCVSPDCIYDGGKPNAANLPALDSALKALTDHGLAVLLDLHDNGQLKLDAPGNDNSGLANFWEAIARRYKARYEDSVVFEIVNEPVFNQNNEAVWYGLQKEVVKAIRAVDPKRTIMATSTSWSGVDVFLKMQPLSEKNIVYTFHCYDPFFFTHQGASWVGPWPRDMKAVPFPSSPEAVEAILSKNDQQFHGGLKNYGKAKHDATYLRSRIKAAMDWGRKHKVPVVLGEFGAYPPVAPPESRARWFEGMLAAFKAEGCPYALWGYDDALGLGRKVNADGSLWLDPVVLRSLYGR